ncbi:NAD(P)-dependent oxidoreductase [Burkholderia pseudomultivorans]|uniref:2-(Hydroxymethyl)glutarate dehydrogenase n=1 Tax=Burkholderia pseudomultivorans TaxID=1207504 RepID=A0ABU2E3T6_9BURK|nr:NAD(P)-dependent oxidoreductase [Burkholderia pseudomultivorans]MDR8726045.1 2-(hydroxymethyl)glutarate dehydrogenase [Burkholderia pseudomultivorans]MDR8735059.1 2-(hydroxymethyl)glutarate dehydrogenase [Burkholderia pseudomultivorans]MDR8741120.1 2-(hydroxymethyl)glutarate dehydrogenase [Burkholderia pseudomultivorans]MDR8754328.1 2-(hydroxymethyl)glutarate dehydrogenase [Burkholderia pseudomultivorans]MDR8777439.1 2-(hydroxymethyl)glutarate dehydrogenase [Burkholderia pseudomultivorans]
MEPVKHIGFLGLGQMGGPMAERLLGQSFRLHVYDPSPVALKPFADGGAVIHDSPRSVADTAGIVFACLPNRDVSLAVGLGPDGVVHGTAIRLYAEMSTIGQDMIVRIGDGLAEKGIGIVDAPISGGAPAARAGTLAMLAAGAPALVEQVMPLLSLIGKDVFVMGERAGMAQIMKIVNNIVMATNLVVCSEGLALGAKAGLDPDMMMRLLDAGTAQSFAGSKMLSRAVSGRFDYGAALAIIEKDMSLGFDEARLLHIATPTIDRARDVWHAAYDAGRGAEDFTSILTFVAEQGGTSVRGRPS